MAKATKKNKSNQIADETFKALADQVIEAMEQNPGSWTQSWVNQVGQGLPLNIKTGRPYKGGNIMWLTLVAWSKAYPTNQWGTYKQWREAGYQVQEKEKNTPVVFFKPIIVEDETTTLVTNGFDASVNALGQIVMTKGAAV